MISTMTLTCKADRPTESAGILAAGRDDALADPVRPALA
jgi:hypothetical protein